MTGTRTVVYLGCPASERAECENLLAAASLKVFWTDSTADVLGRPHAAHEPILIDLARGAVALHNFRELRAAGMAPLAFAVVDPSRPDLTTEAILAGIAYRKEAARRPLPPMGAVRRLPRQGWS